MNLDTSLGVLRPPAPTSGAALSPPLQPPASPPFPISLSSPVGSDPQVGLTSFNECLSQLARWENT